MDPTFTDFIHELCRPSEDHTGQVLETWHIQSPVYQGMCSQSFRRNIALPSSGSQTAKALVQNCVGTVYPDTRC